MSVLSTFVFIGLLAMGQSGVTGRQFDRGPSLPVRSVYELDQPRLMTSPLGIVMLGDGDGQGISIDGGSPIDLGGLGLVDEMQAGLQVMMAEHREVFRKSLAELNGDLTQLMPLPLSSTDERLVAVASLMTELDEALASLRMARQAASLAGSDDEAAQAALKNSQDVLDEVKAELDEAKLATVNRHEFFDAGQMQLERLKAWDLKRAALEAALVQDIATWAESQGFPDSNELVDALRRRMWIGLSTLSGEGIDLSRVVPSLELGRAARDVLSEELLVYQDLMHAALLQREMMIARTASELRRAKFDGDWEQVEAIERERMVAAVAIRGVNDLWLKRLVELVAGVNPAHAAKLQSEGLRAAYPRVFEPTRNQERIARAILIENLTPVARTQALAAEAALQEQMKPLYERLVEAVRAYEPLRALADASRDSDEGVLMADVARAGARLRYLLGEQKRLEKEAIEVLSQYVFDSDQAEMDRIDRAIDPTPEQDREMDDQEGQSP
ncbi:MAG: hypothetical protein P8J86_12755 [Phycisphaerales bacterium]|nr:hypothetical protein [Phycisphaerales bacterium]